MKLASPGNPATAAVQAPADAGGTSAAPAGVKVFSLPRQVLDASHSGGVAGLDDFLKMVVGLAGAAGGAIRALTGDGEYLRLMAAVGVTDEFLQREMLVGVCGVCGDAVRDDDIRSSSDFRGCSQLFSARKRGGCFRHVIAVPLEYKNEPVGVFNLFFDQPDTSHQEIKILLKPIGQLLGLTLENAALERENARVTLLGERQAMATDIHDSLAQTLAFSRMRLPLLEDAIREHDEVRAYRYCNELNQELTRSHRALRDLITQFRAGMDGRGLRRGLREMVERFRDSSGIALEFDNQIPDLKLPGESEVQVFFIVQEALANIRKHARATRARLVVESVDGGIEVLVEDNGCGLLQDIPSERCGGVDSGFYGLRIMRERAQRFGGRVAFENLPKGGARVRVFIPDQHAALEANRK